MTCAGDCFDLAAPPSCQGEGSSESPMSSGITPLPHFTYSPLQPWQTRILRLHPRGTRAGDEDNNIQLRGDLLTANLHALDGVTVEGDSNIISYTALSYSWGRPELLDVLICNGQTRPISRSNAAALKALRHPTQPIHLWIDAVCINQEDVQEKSRQVAEMLLIYKKAQSVTAWLGEVDDADLLALACIRNPAVLSALTSGFRERCHGASCLDQLRAMYKALLCFYEKPWLRRTWIRQEIFGARQLVMQCGMHQISWDAFIQGSKTLAIIRSLLPDQNAISYEVEASLARLLEEAQLNATIPLSGIKSPRTLTEVLLASPLFEVSDQRDTFYAILGMCNVSTHSNKSDRQSEARRAAVLVDYSKPVVEVFNDASLCIIGRRGNPRFLMDMWHSYRRGPLHSQGLASWAVDWRSGVLEEGDRAALKHHMRSYQASFERSPRVLDSDNYAELLRRPRDLFEVRDVHLARGWTPLWTAPVPDGTAQSHRTAGIHDGWYWPKSLQSERCCVLSLKARVLNYVAHLTDFTCDVQDFLETFNKSKHEGGPYPFELEQTGISIHARASVDRRGHLFHHLRWTTPYSPQRHSWRLAILGVANDAQLCLVPSTAVKGDLIVAVGPGMLPMLIHPTQDDDGTAGGLFNPEDPYGKLSHGAIHSQRHRPWTPVLLCPILWATWATRTLLVRCQSVFFYCLVHALLPRPVERAQWPTGTLSVRSNPLFDSVLYLRAFLADSPWSLVCRLFILGSLSLPVVRNLLRRMAFKQEHAKMRARADHRSKTESTGDLCFSICCLLTKTFVAGAEPAVTLVWAIHAMCWLPELTWRFYRSTNDGICRAVQRAKVRSRLDNAAETMGRDCAFRGPVFVYQERSSQDYEEDDSAVLGPWARWCGFVCVIFANKLSRAKLQLSRAQRKDVYREVFPTEAYKADRLDGGAWKRPVQEFRVH